MRRILTIRFGSLGDLCLLGWSLARFTRPAGDERFHVTLVTKPQFAPLMAQLPGVDEVVTLTEPSFAALRRLATDLKSRDFERVIDAHSILRSHVLLMLMGRRPDARLAKDTLARLDLLLRRRRRRALTLTMRDRFAKLFAPLLGGGAATSEPESEPVPPWQAVFQSEPPDAAPVLGLAPGAMWGTKRWPDHHFAELTNRFRREFRAEIRVYVGPRETDWFAGSDLAAAIAQDPNANVIQGRSLVEVAASLASCSALVTNDSGLMHLAEGVGTPVVALFGPTVREFGYFPSLSRSRVLEVDLACRPCSRNGKRPCHRGDLACLVEITPGEVLAALRPLVAWPEGTTSEAQAGKEPHA